MLPSIRTNRHPNVSWHTVGPLLWVPLSASILTLISFSARFSLLRVRVFDPDEFEHLHCAWLISQGFLPYRDFFEHHTPWFHFALAPFFRFFDVSTTVDDAIAFLFFARSLMWVVTAAILLLTLYLGTLWRGARVGFIAMVFLTNTEVFFTTTLEVRPDLLAVVLWLGCLLNLVYVFKFSKYPSGNGWRFALSGALLGAGIMTTQKLLFALPGLGVGLVFYLLDTTITESRRTRAINAVLAIAGCSVPILVTLGYFHAHNGLREFLEFNVLMNAQWKENFTPYARLRQLMYQNPYLTMFGIAGFVVNLNRLLRHRIQSGDHFLVPATLGAVAGLFVISVPFLQYYLIFLPLVALFAAAFLAWNVDALSKLRNQMLVRNWLRVVALAALVIIVGLRVISSGIQSPWGTGVVITYWFGSLVVALIFLGIKRSDCAVGLFLVAISLPALKQTHDTFRLRNTRQLEQIRYVLGNTTPADSVLDGFTGVGVFRSHAWFYFMPHYGLRLMIGQHEWHRLQQDLESFRVSPKLIVFDRNVRSFPSGISNFLRDRYEPVGVGEIWRVKERR